jgi:hypothetical protein
VVIARRSFRSTVNSDSDYRKHLVDTRQKSQDAYDKTVLALSAGALGVTISFVKEIVGGHPRVTWLLFTAWACWGISCAAVLYSHFSSVAAHKEAIAALDENREPEIGSNKATKIFNIVSGAVFLLGLLFFCVFAYINL